MQQNNKSLSKLVQKSRKKYANVKISRELRDIIHGLIASDSFVRYDGSMTIEQSSEKQKFVQWLYDQLKDLRTDYPFQTVSRLDKRSNTTTSSYRFFTRALLKGFHKMWYIPVTNAEGKTSYVKRLPKKMDGFFSSTFITVWFACDGTKIIGSKGAKFEVSSLSADERRQYQELFKNHFDINVAINRAGKSKTGNDQWSLSINAPEYAKFRSLITQIDLIPRFFPHKLHKAD